MGEGRRFLRLEKGAGGDYSKRTEPKDRRKNSFNDVLIPQIRGSTEAESSDGPGALSDGGVPHAFT